MLRDTVSPGESESEVTLQLSGQVTTTGEHFKLLRRWKATAVPIPGVSPWRRESQRHNQPALYALCQRGNGTDNYILQLLVGMYTICFCYKTKTCHFFFQMTSSEPLWNHWPHAPMTRGVYRTAETRTNTIRGRVIVFSLIASIQQFYTLTSCTRDIPSKYCVWTCTFFNALLDELKRSTVILSDTECMPKDANHQLPLKLKDAQHWAKCESE